MRVLLILFCPISMVVLDVCIFQFLHLKMCADCTCGLHSNPRSLRLTDNRHIFLKSTIDPNWGPDLDFYPNQLTFTEIPLVFNVPWLPLSKHENVCEHSISFQQFTECLRGGQLIHRWQKTMNLSTFIFSTSTIHHFNNPFIQHLTLQVKSEALKIAYVQLDYSQWVK